MRQDQFAQLIEQAYKDALAAADAIKENAAADREAARQELESAKKIKGAAQAEGKKVAQEYFEKHKAELVEKVRHEWLADIVRKHFEAGKSKAEIIEWLELDDDFVEDIRVEFILKNPPVMDARLEYYEYPRGGTVTYVKGNTRLVFDWEFGGRDTVSLIFVPREEHWESRTGLPLSERPSVLDFVGQQVVRDKARGCKYRIRAETVEVYRG